MKINKTPPRPQVKPNAPSSVSEGLERAFLSEMLKYAGPRALSGEFSGGIGESQFASLLIDSYADAIEQQINFNFKK